MFLIKIILKAVVLPQEPLKLLYTTRTMDKFFLKAITGQNKRIFYPMYISLYLSFKLDVTDISFLARVI